MTWVSVGVSGCQWVSVGVSGCQWVHVSVGVSGDMCVVWVSVGVSGCQWVSVGAWVYFCTLQLYFSTSSLKIVMRKKIRVVKTQYRYFSIYNIQ